MYQDTLVFNLYFINTCSAIMFHTLGNNFWADHCFAIAVCHKKASKIAVQKWPLNHDISIIWFIFCRWLLPLSPEASIGYMSTFTGWRSRVLHSHSGSEKTSGKPGNRRPTFSKLTEKYRGRKRCLFGWLANSLFVFFAIALHETHLIKTLVLNIEKCFFCETGTICFSY